MKPILFNTEMVRAILDGRKTTTRRIVKFNFNKVYTTACAYGRWNESYGKTLPSHLIEWYVKSKAKPPYQIGDVLYVRETFCSAYDGESYFFLADKCTGREQKKLLDYDDVRWHPSLHMPKEAARIFLKVTNVRAERLQDITEEQAIKEGASKIGGILDFKMIWEDTLKKDNYAAYRWNANPFVWVVEFERCEKTGGTP